jgi:hypothetical protein
MSRKLLVKDDAQFFYFVDECNMIFDPRRSGESIGEESLDGLTSIAWDFSVFMV